MAFPRPCGGRGRLPPLWWATFYFTGFVMHFSSRVGRLGGKGSTAWEIHFRGVEAQRRGEEVILLSVGDPDFDSAPNINAALKASLDAGDTHYGDIPGDPRLRQAIAKYHTRLTGQEVTYENVVVMAGAQSAMFAAAQVLLGEGDAVVVPSPRYVTYEALIGAAGGSIVDVPLLPERGFHLDPADLERAASAPNVRGIMLTTPNNPTGAVMTREEIEAVADVARRRDLWVLTDEVYASLAHERPHVSPASLPGMAERAITVCSLSKSHAMTGFRIGWAVGPKDFVAHYCRLVLCMIYSCPPFIQAAAIEAIEGDQAPQAKMREAYKARGRLVFDRIGQSPHLTCTRPEGGMFVMIDVRRTGLSAQDFAEGLFREEKVTTLVGDAFGPEAAGHLRLSMTYDLPVMEEACRRILRFAERHAA